MLDQYQLEQDHRIAARAAVVFTVQIFYKTINVCKVHCCINLSQQMILGYEHIGTQHFYCLTLFHFLLQHCHHLLLLYQKRPLLATFFDRLRPRSCGAFPVIRK